MAPLNDITFQAWPYWTLSRTCKVGTNFISKRTFIKFVSFWEFLKLKKYTPIVSMQ